MSLDAPFRIERLADHDRRDFDSGSAPLDQYLRTQVGQDIRRRVTSCFVAVGRDGVVAGFYTLAPTGIAYADLPETVTRRLPRYALIPAYRLGRLAVDRRAQGLKLGAALLADTLLRALRAEATGYALVVDAKDEAAAFYRRQGFLEFSGLPLSLFIPLATGGKAAG